MQVKLFQSRSKNKLAEKAREMSDQVIMHIVYLSYLAKGDEGLYNYWIKELTNKLNTIKSTPKNGKFSYLWYFEPNLEFDPEDVQKYIDAIDEDHENLKPEEYDPYVAINNVYDLIEKLIAEPKIQYIPAARIKAILLETIKQDKY